MKRNEILTLLLFFVLSFIGCGFEKEVLISGKTMGTTYHIKVVSSFFNSTSGLKEQIDKQLDEINQSMSIYIKDSEISRFNSMAFSQRLDISPDFMNVLKVSAELYDLSEGAWDGTVKPLVDLWGFGNTDKPKTIPTHTKIKLLLQDIGFKHIVISNNGYIEKKKQNISLDFGSIAKGYAVDQVALLINSEGFENFLVEIGGEVYAAGYKKNGDHWQVGINQPGKNAFPDQVYKVVPLHNRALATSGDYRNFFEINGKRYAHIMDPRTGSPVNNGVVSVSVTADSCAFADGLATALMVMGPEKGLELVNQTNNVESVIIVRRKDGVLIDYYSNGFKTLMKDR